MSTVNGWGIFPSGRWCKTIECGGGHIAMHAFVSGAWAITRGKALGPFGAIAYRSIDHGTSGKDLEEAMALAEAKGAEIYEQENPMNRFA